jgi:hypothetical protein
MSDQPRFEPVRGEPHVAHEAYYGGALVSLVFRLVDRWRGRRHGQANAPATTDAGDGIEIHERPAVLAPAAAAPPGAAEGAAERALYQVSPDENFSGNFLIGSARTMKVQAGLLAAFVGVMVVLLAQGLPQSGPSLEQTVAAAAGQVGR